MSQRSLLISHLGSSIRSDLDAEEADRGSDPGRGPRSRPLEELLTLLPPGDRSLDNLSDTSGDQSVVSHPFSEQDTPRFADNEKESQFSSTYQEVMNGVKKEETREYACSSCSSCDTCSTDTWEALGIDEAKIARLTPRPLPPDVEKGMHDKLSEFCIEKPQHRRRLRSPMGESGAESRELTVRSPGADSGVSRRSHSRRTAVGGRRTQSKARELDAMSGLWNMLATYEEFVVTPPGFNLYQQEKPHWLDQEQIPWEERERARRKCVKWLRNYHL